VTGFKKARANFTFPDLVLKDLHWEAEMDCNTSAAPDVLGAEVNIDGGEAYVMAVCNVDRSSPA
jgi:hypothetical protein